MGVLMPIYLAGLAALSLPLILHLVRRTPRGRQDFSSLMFLTPTPPKLTRRSRLDQILLLLLRLAALALLAFAFARPFLREAASLALGDLPGRKVAILLDTSASMRRADLWQQATAAVEKELDDLNPQDDVALFAFGGSVETILDFDKEGTARVPDKPQLARQRLRKLRPTFAATDLAGALVRVAGDFAAATDVQQWSAEPQIVVVSDFQKGSKIDSLQGFEWPKNVRVVIRQVETPRKTNAFAHLLPSEEDDEDARPRVRVVNAADSQGDQFSVGWVGDELGTQDGGAAAVYVPAGQSRVVRLPRPREALTADKLVLRGDDHDFDNTFFVVPPRKQQITLVYSGPDQADDSQGLQYYLRLAVDNDLLREVSVVTPAADQLARALGPPAPQLVVVAQPLDAGLIPRLTSYVEQGGLVLIVLKDRETAAAALPLVDDLELAPPSGDDESPKGSDDLLLGEIDFTHPLFAPFASPRYSDFTMVHFWKHQALTQKSPAVSRILARYDNRDPALLERSSGKGRTFVLASGWNPDDSQLALSGKFVALVGGLIDLASGVTPQAGSVAIDEPLILPTKQTAPVVVTTPAGKELKLPADSPSFAATSEPGIYRIVAGDSESRAAVNLAAAESDTAPLDLEQLQQRGVKFDAGLTRAERIARVRQQRDTELESRQKVWRWLIALALVGLVAESWWAGRAAHKIHTATEAA